MDPGASCPECGEASVGWNPLDLYGVGFAPTDPGAAALIQARQAALEHEGDTLVDEDERVTKLRVIGKILAHREVCQKKAVELHDLRNKAAEGKAKVERHAEKLRAAEKTDAKKAEECSQLKQEVEQLKKRHETLTKEIDLIRQRDAVREYWDKLKAGNEKEAQTFLSTTVSIVPNEIGLQLLTEVAKLRDHQRGQLQKRQKEAHAAAQREQRTRHELEQRRKAVADLKQRVGEGARAHAEGGLGRPRPASPATAAISAAGVAKRARVEAQD